MAALGKNLRAAHLTYAAVECTKSEGAHSRYDIAAMVPNVPY